MYTKTALIKASYQFTDVAFILLDADNTHYIVNITYKDGSPDGGLEGLFENELLMQSARQIVSQQTKEIRELLMARAFASTVVYSEEKVAVPDNPADNESLDSILNNWFDKYEEK